MRYIFIIILSQSLFFLSQCNNVNFEIVSKNVKMINGETSNYSYIIYTIPVDYKEMSEYARKLQKKNKSFVTEILFFDNLESAKKFKKDSIISNKILNNLTAKYNYKLKGNYEEFCYGNESILIDNNRYIDGWRKCNQVGLLNYFDRRLYK